MLRRLGAALRVLFHGEQAPPEPRQGWGWLDLPQDGWETLFVVLPDSVSASEIAPLTTYIKAQLAGPAPRLVPLPSGTRLLFKRDPAPATPAGQKE